MGVYRASWLKYTPNISVVPTLVGVYQSAWQKMLELCGGCPHARGGVPDVLLGRVHSKVVVPTLVGVYRSCCRAEENKKCSPCSRWL